jgi:hypothetical protein
MVEHDPDRTLNGDPLDREIDALLQVEPSAQFAARVRARVDAQPISHDSWPAGQWLAVAVSIVVIVAGMAWWFERPAPAVVADQYSSLPVARSVLEPAPVRTNAPPTISAPRRSTEVLVSPTESATVERLLIVARNARRNPSARPAEEAASLNPPMPIVIEPITVEPLMTADIERGAQQ